MFFHRQVSMLHDQAISKAILSFSQEYKSPLECKIINGPIVDHQICNIATPHDASLLPSYLGCHPKVCLVKYRSTATTRSTPCRAPGSPIHQPLKDDRSKTRSASVPPVLCPVPTPGMTGASYYGSGNQGSLPPRWPRICQRDMVERSRA